MGSLTVKRRRLLCLQGKPEGGFKKATPNNRRRIVWEFTSIHDDEEPGDNVSHRRESYELSLLPVWT